MCIRDRFPTDRGILADINNVLARICDPYLNLFKRLIPPIGGMAVSYTHLDVYKRQTQPLTLPSCGSVFKNPEGSSAGQLIEQVGLKGERVGGAQISEVHANFIVNRDNATAQDVLELINMARSKVYEAYGIELQPEVRFLGFA